jgi:glycerol-3-phosphate cytidylyltransferase
MSGSDGGKSVCVYADAVCDLFHYGHVEFFRQARALGDRLIVGINSDRDAAVYKPPPIMTHAERVAVVRGCRFVDQVLDAPPPLYCTRSFLDEIGADFCCHGDDMSAQELARWYGDLMPSGRLKLVRYTPTISSRQIVARIVDRLREDGRLNSSA